MQLISVIRRMLLIVSLMFWQGGFMFYGGVVIPVGARILESDTQQGFITQSVTNFLNLAGGICLILWIEHLWNDRRNGVSPWEWGLWFVAVVLLFALLAIHVQMDRLIHSESFDVVNSAAFDRFHKLYIGSSSLQWMASLGLLSERIRHWSRPLSSKPTRPLELTKNTGN